MWDAGVLRSEAVEEYSVKSKSNQKIIGVEWICSSTEHSYQFAEVTAQQPNYASAQIGQLGAMLNTLRKYILFCAKCGHVKPLN